MSAILPIATSALHAAKTPTATLLHATASAAQQTPKPTASTKNQPWKAFWPLDPAKYTEVQRQQMPWLTYKYDPTRPNERPWRKWMLQNQSTVVRRGAW
ncbi:hypothetical protein ASPCAL01610 [Aspergillus calidoustus]|uniref:Uncharacterized protein n=1 Tax=Aspergillus calidoustus TaxID=454130 RepID=A0A0U5FRX3_ASPCI|nr:hypothetical protein ASPCAL01610 [Aspergillus calidoustus]